jgi:hypothetical protein
MWVLIALSTRRHRSAAGVSFTPQLWSTKGLTVRLMIEVTGRP